MAMTTWEGAKFAETFLDEIKEWVAEMYNIDELYSERDIQSWLEEHAKDYGYVMED